MRSRFLVNTCFAATAFVSLSDYRHLKSGRVFLECAAIYKWNKDSPNVKHDICARKLLGLFLENGGVYVKIGQSMAALVYLLPAEYTNTLKVLQNQCSPRSLDLVKLVIEKEVDISSCQITSLHPEPLGVGSLAQVHKGTMVINGQQLVVAFKVQHAELESQALADIRTCANMVQLLKYMFPEFNLFWLADELEMSLPLELDFRKEAENCRLLEANNTVRGVYFPKVYLATKRLLVMECNNN